MIQKKRIAKWLMITLIMAIGIGTFGALHINSEKEKEANDAHPSSYLTNQRQHDIDMTELKSCIGDYQAVESGSPAVVLNLGRAAGVFAFGKYYSGVFMKKLSESF